ncbi:hypothetical protein DT87_31080 [Streptomyces sp. NTK 937]|nr:hypothetical protein DT87_31080 [Streptomyces sp. NTK 937]
MTTGLTWQDDGSSEVGGALGEYREFVYLSDAKLRQFSMPRRLALPSALRVNTPVGGVDVDGPAADSERDRLKQLEKLDKYLESGPSGSPSRDCAQGYGCGSRRRCDV